MTRLAELTRSLAQAEVTLQTLRARQAAPPPDDDYEIRSLCRSVLEGIRAELEVPRGRAEPQPQPSQSPRSSSRADDLEVIRAQGHKDLDDLADRHHRERRELTRDQWHDWQDLKTDHDREHQDVRRDHADERRGIDQDDKREHNRTARAHKTERAELHEAHKAERAERLDHYRQEHADLKEDHRRERRESLDDTLAILDEEFPHERGLTNFDGSVTRAGKMGNPHHVASGEKGGQFTSGGGGAAGKQPRKPNKGKPAQTAASKAKAREKARKAKEKAKAKAKKDREKARAKAKREKDRAKAKAKREKDKARDKARREKEKTRLKAKKEREKAREKAKKEREKARATRAKAKEKTVAAKPKTEVQAKSATKDSKEFDSKLKSAAGEYLAPYDPSRKHEVAKLINEHSVPGPTGAFHGMTNPEKFTTITSHGINFHYVGQATHDSPIVKTLEVFANGDVLSKSPKRLLDATKDVYLSTQENKDNSHWAQKYNMPDLKAAATGSKGAIVSYAHGHEHGLSKGVFYHEAGHNLATKVYGDTDPRFGLKSKPDRDYVKAMDSGEKPTTDYASKSPAEDFAESVRGYMTNSKVHEKIAPERHKVIHKLLTDDSYHG